MKLLMLFGVPLILFGLNTCTKNPATVANKSLVDTEWDLQSFEVVGVGESDIGSQGMILVFTNDGRLEGRARTIKGDLSVPGNSYGGVYEVGSDGSLSIEITHTTELGLPAGSRYEEYLQTLRNASAYEIEGNRLRIFYDDQTKALNFKAE
ncbi:MAG: META domain-containing protein [bacterium]